MTRKNVATSRALFQPLSSNKTSRLRLIGTALLFLRIALEGSEESCRNNARVERKAPSTDWDGTNAPPAGKQRGVIETRVSRRDRPRSTIALYPPKEKQQNDSVPVLTAPAFRLSPLLCMICMPVRPPQGSNGALVLTSVQFVATGCAIVQR